MEFRRGGSVFGWIDSLIKRLDDDRYARKFTRVSQIAPGQLSIDAVTLILSHADYWHLPDRRGRQRSQRRASHLQLFRPIWKGTESQCAGKRFWMNWHLLTGECA